MYNTALLNSKPWEPYMSLIRPFRGLRPLPERAADVAAPPYDVLNSEEARERAAGRPWSFLHISKPEIDLPPGTDPYSDAVYAKGAENLHAMVEQGVLIRDEKPCYYLYRLVMGEHSQIGLVAVASVADYDCNRIRKHELTRPEKEDDRVRNIDSLNAQTGPVFLTYNHNVAVDDLVADITTGEAQVDITTPDGIRHSLWVVDDDAQVDLLTTTFDAMDCLYIADGHHRSAAASRVAATRNAAAGAKQVEASHDYFLTVIFPDNQMQILDYNRVLKDLNGLSAGQLLERARAHFDVAPSDGQARPTRAGEFGMYVDGHWYRLTIHADAIPADDPVARLDVSLLTRYLIEPVLGVADQRRDKRIDFVGGIRGLDELERRVNSGEMSVAFALYPTSIEQLMDVANAEKLMPPKSTWFEPKLADGLVSHVLD